jgi:hypothetical protein
MKDQLSPVHADRTEHRDDVPSLRGVGSRRSRRLALPALAAASAALLLAGCGGDGDAAAVTSSKPPTVEKLASALGCKPKFTRGKVEDYRQAVCKLDKQLYTLVTFKNNKAKRGWLEFSKSYGGIYLVGSRWMVAGNVEDHLEKVKAKYGGSIEEGANHGGDHGGGDHDK